MTEGRLSVGIVDYGMGNLFSVQRACEIAGLHSLLASNPDELLAADAVVLPGVGAFGQAMTALRARGLDVAIRSAVTDGKPLLAVCLGMQLLMSESEEFGRHEGLGLVEGTVVPLRDDGRDVLSAKVPHVGWTQIQECRPWEATLLEGISSGVFMYFVHSYFVKPSDSSMTIAISSHGRNEFCSALEAGSLFGSQFHPERSGAAGIRVYRNFASRVRDVVTESIVVGRESS